MSPAPAPSHPAPVVRLRGVGKTYATRVLDGIDLDLFPGEVHALVGENGAGKSTLCRILSGLTPATDGGMELNGQPYRPRSKRDGEGAGVHMVMQELNLIGTLSVAENIFLDHLPHRAGWIDFPKLYQRATEVLDRIGMRDLDPRTTVDQLGVGPQQMVEIAASLWRQCRILILDEPTAALTEPEVKQLFEQIRNLRAAGVAILYISHRLEEIRQIADRISILRDGRLVGTQPAASLTLDEIVRRMVGRELGAESFAEGRTAGAVALSVRHLRRGHQVRDVSFDAHRGEILGFAGLMGSGRTETMRAIFGADQPDAGDVFLHGNSQPSRFRSPREAVQSGLALLNEDRKAQGLFLSLGIRENLTINALHRLSGFGGWLRRSDETSVVRSWIDKLAVRCHSPDQGIVELSGGNQQKVIVARWLFRDCDILIFDEPTRGVDIGARFEIYHLLADLAAQGKAVIVVSSDLLELMSLCDRIAVMSAGRLAATFRRGEWTQDKIMAAALSEHLAPTRATAASA
ncbi:MAG: sugar ABC transporter ATP-binding protein [Verrucomicrobiales bacterium]|nr:sugar ABC transporter ATP-binding protein [Verrucomicrobiales bacterium]